LKINSRRGMWKQKEVELDKQAWGHLDMTETWHTRTESKLFINKLRSRIVSHIQEFILNFIGNAGNIHGSREWISCEGNFFF